MADESVIKFKTQSEALFATKLSLNETLFNIRIKLVNDLPKGSSFIYQDGTKILKEDENKFTLKDIAKKEKHKKNYIVYLGVVENNYNQDQSNDEIYGPSSSSRYEENFIDTTEIKKKYKKFL